MSYVSKAHQALYKAIQQIFPDALINHKILDMEVDIFVPSFNFVIEYDGAIYHALKTDKDMEKSLNLLNGGVKLLRIRGKGLDNLDSIPCIQDGPDIILRTYLYIATYYPLDLSQLNKLNSYAMSTPVPVVMNGVSLSPEPVSESLMKIMNYFNENKGLLLRTYNGFINAPTDKAGKTCDALIIGVTGESISFNRLIVEAALGKQRSLEFVKCVRKLGVVNYCSGEKASGRLYHQMRTPRDYPGYESKPRMTVLKLDWNFVYEHIHGQIFINGDY